MSLSSSGPSLPPALQELSRLPLPAKKLLLAELTRGIDRYERRRSWFRYYPDEGPLRRDLYPRHVEFFTLGTTHDERALIAANRTGKTTAASYELVAHLTGRYPDWWPGRRYSKPVIAWAASENAKLLRDGAQAILFGMAGNLGEGMIPGDDIVGTPTSARGLADSIDTAAVKHATGGVSRITLKSYEQGRESFQAAKIDVGWCDEEPPIAIYTEMLTRLLSTTPGERNGSMMCTFTPLKGISEVVSSYLGEDWRPT